MAEKARHAFGDTERVESAIQAGTIDSYDILFLDGETEPKVGWVDSNGIFRLAKGKDQVVRVSELPAENGDENVVYICNNECFIWDGTQCIPLSKSADLTTLENQVAQLETQLEGKVDEATVNSKVEAAVEAAIESAVGEEVIEF